MTATSLPEYWLSGALPNIPALLQPVAHALLQARREITDILTQLPEHLLWQKPGGNASIAFHLQHIAGVLDRLFTYASSRQLAQAQLTYLQAEGVQDSSATKDKLLNRLSGQVDVSLQYLENIEESTLTEQRFVGRKMIPSTLIGLLFHAAEHTMRHTGQLLVTAKVLLEKDNENALATSDSVAF